MNQYRGENTPEEPRFAFTGQGSSCPNEYAHRLAIERGADPDKLPDPCAPRSPEERERERYELWRHVYSGDPLMKPPYRTRLRFRLEDARERVEDVFAGLF
ncbi:MAG: hypothetical protein SVW02_00205 [Candidatus Nanohaloarchaea archaeon]|nr:hypothetical protein [Candidatus Nanohaloarchaea archaeon]